VDSAKLVILIDPDALRSRRADSAINLLRTILQAPPDILQNFFGHVPLRLDGNLGDNLTDQRARTCVADLVTGVPEILYFLPLDCMVFAVYQTLPATVVISDTARKGAVSVDRAKMAQVLLPLLRGLRAAMTKAHFSEESYLRHADNILNLFGVPKEGRSRLLQ
jgi:hypothetical protein